MDLTGGTTTTGAAGPRMTGMLPAEYRGRLMSMARDVGLPQGIRLFGEGERADHFWIVRSGTVALDLRVPGVGRSVTEPLGFGDLVGWSWLTPPYVWQAGAETVTSVRAHEFDAAAVRQMCGADPAMGSAIARWVGRVVDHRLRSAGKRLDP